METSLKNDLAGEGFFTVFKTMYHNPILIIHSASADRSAAKYSEMSAILGFLDHIQPP